MTVWFRLLGGIEAEVGGVPVELGSAKQRGVLAVLLVEAGQLVPMDRLLTCVWGEPVPVRARNSLYTYLSGLRAALSGAGDVQLERRSGGYRLTVEEQRVDLHVVRELVAGARAVDDERAVELFEQALGMWRGAPLADLDTPWADSLRVTLGRERLAAELDHVDVALRLGRHAELLPGLADRAQRHPLDERVAGQLMLALYRSGRQADALEQYRQVRMRLVDELGADPGVRLQELYRRILDTDADLTAPARAAVAVASVVVPRQLPAPPRLFTGRTDESARLTKAVEAADATVVISALAGAGGIGKTWLALHWAHHNTDRFPDGQLFVDLHGFSPTGPPTAPEEALRGFLGALGVAPDRIPHDPDAKSALFRSLVADRRMLIVLDNAATADQVVPLLPGTSTCTVLVTSRNRLPGLIARHGAQPLPLDVLTDTDAHALLVAALGAERVAADEPAAAELIALCGGFPLALGLITARAAAEPHLPLAEAVAELRESGLDALDDDDPTASLPAVLSWSLRHLTEQQRIAFAMLGIAPGPDIDLPAAASLTGLPARDTRAVLRALADASLIDTQHPGGRYAMHDVVRAYAAMVADTLPEPVRLSALDRVVDFYLHTAHTAAFHLNPHRPPITLDPPAPGTHPHPLPDHPAAMDWLDAHHPHLLATQHTAVHHHRYQTVWHLAWTLTTFHQRRGHRHDALAVWQTALDVADHLPDPTIRILAHRYLGAAHAESGRHDPAISHLNQALALAEQHDDPTQQAHTHDVFARVWELQDDDRRALEHCRLALDLFRTLDNPVWEADLLASAGWFAARLGDYDTAREHCQAALVLQRQHNYTDGEATTLDSLGYIDHHTGNHHQAIEYYRQALALFHTLGYVTVAANALDTLGHSHAALGQRDQTRAVWQEALKLYREQGRDTDAQRIQQQLDNLDKTTHHSPAGAPDPA
ncbi:BTAD domain-containing putative transcriptional regulator [Actinosynnema sp. CS-041913]|uniref:AfsR/SARP family transcriptional regulator n=1 Tax=Actinosynnema sp. CS-041913 TaxID=3239917 RepID=UPI003D8D2F0F